MFQKFQVKVKLLTFTDQFGWFNARSRSGVSFFGMIEIPPLGSRYASGLSDSIRQVLATIGVMR